MILPQYQRKGYGRFLIDFSKDYSNVAAHCIFLWTFFWLDMKYF